MLGLNTKLRTVKNNFFLGERSMDIKEISKEIDPFIVMEILAKNEISGNENVICKFSYAGGKSGYSFGRSQFDVTHNLAARKFLTETCGFLADDIARLLNLDINISDLNKKLSEHRKDIDNFDLSHVKTMIKYVGNLENMPKVDTAKTFIQLIDYHNQFNLERNGKFHNWLKERNFITSKSVLDFKLNETKWGKEQPQDVMRRYNNIVNF